ncbi:MAG TPA: iron ABC transporter ATP-binding protein [Planctomycetaceae bacterium]|nr:iron ABC transporter ATP-binding protein [Planctomycetaceae bacterium]
MMLDVENLAFQYGCRSVLHDISFRLAPGEIVAVLGPNGSGKSTLLRCLNRILRPERGTVRLAGQPLAAFSAGAIARRIAYVPQHIESAPFSVYDAVLLGRKPYFTWRASESDHRIVESMIRRLGLDPLVMRPVDQLSGGETQKVALARALVQEPKLLLLDEPTSALDLKNQVELLGMLREIVRERNIMAILSMHDINVAVRYMNRFLLLREGRLLGDVRHEGLVPEILENVYDLPVEIHTSEHGISFIIEKIE